MVEFIVTLSLLMTSLLANVVFFLKLKKKKHRPDSYELQEHLQDLREGWSMLAVKRVDREGLMYRSPKDLR